LSRPKKLGCFDKERKSYVGLLHDAVKVKADLVFNKHTGQLLDFVNLDAITNELLQLDSAASGERQLAQSMLVVMVRGITTNLCYPFASYATTCLSACALYTIVWEIGNVSST
jgi:hypothetical protein